jgi:colicin import membrane protein
MSNIVKIDPKEFGLTDQTAANIAAQFQPMLDKMVELEEEFNQVVRLPIEDPETSKKAKEVRLKYVKIRTGTAEIHKQQKQFYLNGGRFVDGWKNAQIFASQGKEAKLEEIEKYQEILESERIAKLQNEREDALRPYVDDIAHLDLGKMHEDVWNSYFATKKQQHADKIAAEAEAERLRIEAEKKQMTYNERLRALAPYSLLEFESDLTIDTTPEEFDLYMSNAKAARVDKDEQLAAARKEAERLAKEAAEKDVALAAEREAARKEAARIEAERQKELAAERAKQAELQAQIDAKKKAEAEAEAARIKAEEAARKEAERLAKAPVKKQMQAWVNDFSLPATNLDNATATEIKAKFEAFKKWSNAQIENL